MGRNAIEFQCNGGQKDRKATEPPYNGSNCGWYNYPPLRDNMTGNYIIVCGNCGHEHYRVIVKGVVTDDRHSQKYGEAERIHVPSAACQKEKRQLGLIAQFRQMEAAGLATSSKCTGCSAGCFECRPDFRHGAGENG